MTATTLNGIANGIRAFNRMLPTWLTILALGIPAQHAVAQLQLEEIVVTATKQEERLQDVPISITAFGAEEIENYGFRTLEDIDSTVPNFRLNGGQGYAIDTTLSIRGVTSRETAAGFEPTVAVVIDDVYVGRAIAFNTTLLDLESIEVLRGPQGTLQGRNVVGGAVNIRTSKPADEFQARGRVSYERFNTYQFTGVLTGPLSEYVAGKVAISHGDGDGWGKNVDLGKNLAAMQSTALRSQVRFTPGPRLEITLTGDYRHDQINDPGLDSDPDFTLTSASPALLDRRFGGDFLNESKRDVFGLASNVHYDFDNGLTFVSVSSFRGFDFDTLLDQDNALTISDAVSIGVHSRALREQTQFSQELRLHSNQNDIVRWLAGIYYYNEDLDTDADGLFGPYIPGVGILGTSNRSDSTIKTEAYAVFGSVEFEINDAWMITGGFRFDNSDRDFTAVETIRFDGILPPPAMPPGIPPRPYVAITAADPVPSSFVVESPFPATSESINDEEVTGDVTLNYRWNDDISTFAKYARGFKGGGFNARFSFGQSGGTVQPEFVDSYEIGLRSMWFDRRLRLNATAFHLRYTDQQVVNFVIGPTGITFVTGNEPKTESTGAEVEASALLADGLNLNLSLGLLDSEYTLGENKGKIPLDSPDLTFSTVLQYTRPFGNNLELFLMGEASYSDKYFTDNGNAPISQQDSYWMLNARIGIQSADGKWSVRAYGKNLADEDIQTTSLSIQGINSLQALQNPVTYGVELTFAY